jgi:DNA mismatch endonuclease (patch repair protein)
MKGNRGRDTRPEKLIRSHLHSLGLRFRKHARPVPSLRCEADILFRRARVAVFIDGCFWHGCPEHGHTPRRNSDYWQAKISRNVERDRRHDRQLTDEGWKVIRVWEHDPPAAASRRIAKTVLQEQERQATRRRSQGANPS